jgi:DNA-binding NtrC family response regulator
MKTTNYPTGSERILLVDDDLLITENYQIALTKLGYDITVMNCSKSALDIFKLYPHRYDLIITDYNMPNLNGIDLAQEIYKFRSDIPIILFTGFSDESLEEKARTAGIRSFVTKPIMMRNMAKIIRDILDNKLD